MQTTGPRTRPRSPLRTRCGTVRSGLGLRCRCTRPSELLSVFNNISSKPFFKSRKDLTRTQYLDRLDRVSVNHINTIRYSDGVDFHNSCVMEVNSV